MRQKKNRNLLDFPRTQRARNDEAAVGVNLFQMFLFFQKVHWRRKFNDETFRSENNFC